MQKYAKLKSSSSSKIKISTTYRYSRKIIMNYKVFALVVLLCVSSALAEEALFKNKNRKVAQDNIKEKGVDLEPRNAVENGGGFPGGVGGGTAVAGGGPSFLCKWGCCGFGYRGYCSECCGSPQEAKAFAESTQSIN